MVSDCVSTSIPLARSSTKKSSTDDCSQLLLEVVNMIVSSPFLGIERLKSIYCKESKRAISFGKSGGTTDPIEKLFDWLLPGSAANVGEFTVSIKCLRTKDEPPSTTNEISN